MLNYLYYTAFYVCYMTGPPCLAENNLKSIFFLLFWSRFEYKSNIGTCDINTSLKVSSLKSKISNSIFFFIFCTRQW